MSTTLTPFPDLAKQFATAAEAARTDSNNLPFVTLQFSTLMSHKVETDDDKRELTAQAASLAAHWVARISRPEYHGQYIGSSNLLNPLFHALQAPEALPFVPTETAAAIAEACVMLAANGPALLKKAVPSGLNPNDDADKLRELNRAELLGLTTCVLDFSNKCKEFRDNLNLDTRTSKDIAPVKRITLKGIEGAANG